MSSATTTFAPAPSVGGPAGGSDDGLPSLFDILGLPDAAWTMEHDRDIVNASGGVLCTPPVALSCLRPSTSRYAPATEAVSDDDIYRQSASGDDATPLAAIVPASPPAGATDVSGSGATVVVQPGDLRALTIVTTKVMP